MSDSGLDVLAKRLEFMRERDEFRRLIPTRASAQLEEYITYARSVVNYNWPNNKPMYAQYIIHIARIRLELRRRKVDGY